MYKIGSLLLLFIMLSTICEGESMKEQPNQSTYKSIKDVPDSTWKKLSEKKIYFGHQSIGYNIING